MASDVLRELERVIAARMDAHERGLLGAADSRVVRALTGPEEQLLRKVPEEAVEVVLAVTHNGDLAAEVADLWFHTMLVMRRCGLPLDRVLAELASRLPGAAGEFDKLGKK